jgi:hypothetical protein
MSQPTSSSTVLADTEKNVPSPLSRGETDFDDPVILVVATRIHLGEASRIPDHIEEQVRQFCQMVQDIALYFPSMVTVQGVIAVDATRKPAENERDEVDLVSEVQRCSRILLEDSAMVHVLPVQPWGKFVPALNALVTYAARMVQKELNAASRGALMFVSLETIAAPESVQILLSHLHFSDTLVCGAVLPGHEYHGPSKPDATLPKIISEPTAVTLNGLTSPWNTLAVWNVSKLALTGFLAVAEGLHDDPTIAGIEEVATIATLQTLFCGMPEEQMKAKLILLPSSIQWDTASFESDPLRKKWHENKMKSKLSRAAHQLELLQNPLAGTVFHY